MKHIEVVAAIIIHQGTVFTAQRDGKGEVGFKWEFPGGKIEPGESHQAALRRELSEELGLDASIGDHVITVHHTYTTFALTMHCYHVILDPNQTIHLHEHLAFRWLSKDTINDVDWAPADIPVLTKVVELLGLDRS